MNAVTIIIPTINRTDTLREMLQSLLTQTIMPDEVVIVDQSQDNKSKHVAQELFHKYSETSVKNIKLKYIHDPSITGLTQARNRGINIAAGDIIFFFDDDVVLKENYTEETLRVYEKYPDATAVGGVITNYSFLNTPRIKLFNNIFFLGIFHDERKNIFANYKKYTKPIRVSKLPGGAVSYKKYILEQVKFDTHFTGYSFGEDIDFSLRLRHFKILITPYAQLEHKNISVSDERSSPEKYLFWEVSGWTYIYLKNISILQSIFFLWLCVGWLLRSIFRLLKGEKSMCISMKKGLLDGYGRYKQWRKSCLV